MNIEIHVVLQINTVTRSCDRHKKYIQYQKSNHDNKSHFTKTASCHVFHQLCTTVLFCFESTGFDCHTLKRIVHILLYDDK